MNFTPNLKFDGIIMRINYLKFSNHIATFVTIFIFIFSSSYSVSGKMNVDTWLQELKVEAMEKGIRTHTLEKAFKGDLNSWPLYSTSQILPSQLAR